MYNDDSIFLLRSHCWETHDEIEIGCIQESSLHAGLMKLWGEKLKKWFRFRTWMSLNTLLVNCVLDWQLTLPWLNRWGNWEDLTSIFIFVHMKPPRRGTGTVFWLLKNNWYSLQAIDFRLGQVCGAVVGICCGLGIAFFYGWQMALLMVSKDQRSIPYHPPLSDRNLPSWCSGSGHSGQIHQEQSQWR